MIRRPTLSQLVVMTNRQKLFGRASCTVFRRALATSAGSTTSTGSSSGPDHEHIQSDSLQLERDQFGHPRIPNRGYFEEDKCKERLEWTSKFSGASLDHLGEWWTLDGRRDDEASKKLPTTVLKGNAENPIGLVSIPVAATGPLLVRGKHINGYVIVPYATGEPGISASATRGAHVLNESGGAVSRVGSTMQRRTPVFLTKSTSEAICLAEWLQQQVPRLHNALKDVSSHGHLRKIETVVLGRRVHADFRYSTGDAAGQNMVTSMSHKALKWVLDTAADELQGRVDIKHHIIETGLSGDKHISYQNFVGGRGLSIDAEAYISESVLQRNFKMGSEELLLYFDVCSRGMELSGGYGVNLASPDAFSAIGTATGQDVACVTESTAYNSLTLRPASSVEIAASKDRFHGKDVQPIGAHFATGTPAMDVTTNEGGIYASLSIPNASLGTVGGGTMLPTQKECLSILGCLGTGGLSRLGEIFAASTLGLELSVLASLAANRSKFSVDASFSILDELAAKNSPRKT